MTFYKYQGAGNDFIILDNRISLFPKKNNELIASLCNRHFGIGADGLILLENDIESDFKMVYFNADGNESTMCGNGGRCIVAFAKKLKLFSIKTIFVAIDGIHKAEINSNIVSIQMKDVDEIKVSGNSIFADTGSPHHIEIVDDLENFPVVELARKIKSTNYGASGCNINFVEQINNQTFKLRTYERGVENETLACGTGATAAAIAMHCIGKSSSKKITLSAIGGELIVEFDENNGIYSNIILSGPAVFVFKGIIAISS
tara:strand:+ start:4775 stop:5551 length:777 start_codon:yes stop_codon:yes gene_type:complete